MNLKFNLSERFSPRTWKIIKYGSLAVLAVVLLLTNPNQDTVRDKVLDKIVESQANTDEEEAQKFAESEGRDYYRPLVVVHNYYLFSVSELQLKESDKRVSFSALGFNYVTIDPAEITHDINLHLRSQKGK